LAVGHMPFAIGSAGSLKDIVVSLKYTMEVRNERVTGSKAHEK